MVDLNNTDLQHTPSNAGHIFWIYPWTGIYRDLFTLLLNWFFKLLTKKYTFDENTVIGNLSKYFPIDKTIYTDSGRSAMLLALKGLDIKSGDEVILSDLNCPAVIDSIIVSEATPVLVDCNIFCGVNIHEIEKVINNRTKAIILSNIYGQLDDEQEIRKIIGDRRVTIINDLAQSLVIPGITKTFFRDDGIYIFSFGPEKHLYCFGGGAVFSPNNNFINKLKSENTGLVTSDKELLAEALKRAKYYLTLMIHTKFKFLIKSLESRNIIIKFNTTKSTSIPELPQKIAVKKINPIQLVILLRKMTTFERTVSVGLSNFNKIKNCMVKIKTAKIIYGKEINPLYCTIILENSRSAVAKLLSDNHIPTVWNYIPLHVFPRYKLYSERAFPNANFLWKRVLSVPFRDPMTNADIEFVSSKLNLLSQL